MNEGDKGLTATEVGERKERVVVEKSVLNSLIDRIILELNDLTLLEGIDKNSWLYAGCIEDLEKARTRILNYIERVLR